MVWLGDANIKTYTGTRELLKDLLAKTDEKTIVRSMLSDCEYALSWLETGRRPGNKRGVERLAAYQREIPTEIIEKYYEKYYRKTESKIVTDEDWERVEYILSLLTDRERECYELHIGGLKTDAEIADMLGLQRRTVREFISRAEQKVKIYRNKPVPLYLELAL